MTTDADRDLYDRAAARHPTTFRVDPDALAIAERLFGEDPDPLPGRWMDNVFFFTGTVAQHTYTLRCDGHHAPGPCPPGRC